jgi:hypothetical protein
MVDSYAKGTAALAFLYLELTNATVIRCKYLTDYATLLHVTIFNVDKLIV